MSSVIPQAFLSSSNFVTWSRLIFPTVTPAAVAAALFPVGTDFPALYGGAVSCGGWGLTDGMAAAREVGPKQVLRSTVDLSVMEVGYEKDENHLHPRPGGRR